MKSCFKCGDEKPLAEFYRHSRMADGHLNKCKVCTKTDVRGHRKNPKYRSKVLAYDRKRGNRQAPEYQQEYRKRHPERKKANNAVNNALKRGRLKKLDACEHCGTPDNLQGHHTSYARDMWLCVTWLCASCHRTVHACF